MIWGGSYLRKRLYIGYIHDIWYMTETIDIVWLFQGPRPLSAPSAWPRRHVQSHWRKLPWSSELHKVCHPDQLETPLQMSKARNHSHVLVVRLNKHELAFFLEGLNLTCHVFSCRWLLFQPCSIWEWKKNHGKHACRGLRRGEMWGHGAGTPESEKSTNPNKAIEKGHHPVSWIFLGLCYNLQEPILFFWVRRFSTIVYACGECPYSFFFCF